MREMKIVCKNVFKTNNKEEIPKLFTLKWIELINQREKNKELVNISNVK